MASAVLLEEPVECPPEHLQWVGEFLVSCKFKAATRGLLGGEPVTASPHLYCPRATLEEPRQRDFDRFVRLVDEIGYDGRFLGVRYRYLDVPDEAGESWRYWVTDAYFPPAARGMVNKASNLAAPCVPPPPPTLWEGPTP